LQTLFRGIRVANADEVRFASVFDVVRDYAEQGQVETPDTME
jgi:hypothetical protein